MELCCTRVNYLPDDDNGCHGVTWTLDIKIGFRVMFTFILCMDLALRKMWFMCVGSGIYDFCLVEGHPVVS